MSDLERLADLIKKRNAIAADITDIIGRPAQFGHVGEYIASVIFNIELEESASHKGTDGYFTDGPLSRGSVNIKWTTKHDNQMNP